MSLRSDMILLLRSDLYKRVPDRNPSMGTTWQSPLGWTVRFTGVPDAPFVEIASPDGSTFQSPKQMTLAELDDLLP